MTMNDIKFYDTCSLLLIGEEAFQEKFAISSITFNELEKIKTSNQKDADIKFSAQLLLKLLDENKNKYEVVIHNSDYEEVILNKHLEITNDTKILSDAIWYNNNKKVDETIFVTNDLALKHIANLFFGEDSIISIKPEKDCYTGYKIVSLDDEELAYFYSH